MTLAELRAITISLNDERGTGGQSTSAGTTAPSGESSTANRRLPSPTPWPSRRPWRWPSFDCRFRTWGHRVLVRWLVLFPTHGATSMHHKSQRLGTLRHFGDAGVVGEAEFWFGCNTLWANDLNSRNKEFWFRTL
jgi:hypothetical protein